MFYEEINLIEVWVLTSMYNWVIIKIVKFSISFLDEIIGFCIVFSIFEMCLGNIMYVVNIK